jgi:hypothetical protein
MNEQSRPVEPEDGQDTEDTEDAGKTSAEKQLPDLPAGEQYGKARQSYLDPRGSESTREMRDTARRRRDAEEKLQQHLLEAKDHIPNEHHERREHDGSGQHS